MAVSRAVKSGRLVKSVIRNPATGKPTGIIPPLADQEWAANTDLSRDPMRAAGDSRTPDDLTMGEASLAEKHWKAKLAELKYKEAAAELVSASAMRQEFTAAITIAKTRLLGIPTRVKQVDPSLTVTQVALIESLVRECLEGLADGAEV